MKIFLVGAFLTTQMVCNDYPHQATIVCNHAGCETFITDNKLTVNVWKCDFHYFRSRNGVGIFCDVSNNTDKPVIFDTRRFSLRSKTEEYVLSAGRIAQGYKVITLPDTFSVAPGGRGQTRIMEFTSKSKMSQKEFLTLIGTDTLSFEYSGPGGKSRVFGLTGKRAQ